MTGKPYLPFIINLCAVFIFCQLVFVQNLGTASDSRLKQGRNDEVWADYLSRKEEIEREISENRGKTVAAEKAYEIAMAAIYMEAPEAPELAARALELAIEIRESKVRSTIFYRVIIGLIDTGLIEEALSLSRLIEERLGHDLPISATQGWRTMIARAVGDLAEEESVWNEMVQQVEPVLKSGFPEYEPQHAMLSSVLATLAIVQARQGKFEEALRNLSKAKSTGEKVRSSPVNQSKGTNHLKGLDQIEFFRRSGIAEASFLLGDLHSASKYMDDAITLAQQEWVQEIDEQWKIFGLAAQIALSTGNLNSAIVNWERCIEAGLKDNILTGLRRNEMDPQILWAREGLAWAKLRANNGDIADSALSIYEDHERYLRKILDYGSQRQRLSLLSRTDPYSLLAETGQDEVLSRAVIKIKGCVLDSILEDLRLSNSGKSEEFKEIARRLRIAKRNAFESAWREDSESRKFIKEVSLLEAKLGAGLASAGGKSSPLSVTLEDIQDQLSNDDWLCEFIRYRKPDKVSHFVDWYGVVLIGPSGDPKWIPLGEAEIIDGLILKMRRSMSLEENITEAELELLLSDLYAELLAPIEEHIPAGHRLIVSPDSNLACLSFAVLLDSNSQFAMERWEIVYVSTGRDLLTKSEFPKRAPRIAVFADPKFDFVDSETPDVSPSKTLATRFSLDIGELSPLPGTEVESKVIEETARNLNWDCQIFRGENAREEALTMMEQAPDILHFATHGMFLEKPKQGATKFTDIDMVTSHSVMADNPLHRSFLTLSGAQITFSNWKSQQRPNPANDGILTAEEVSHLELDRTWLGVLSACDTASGEVLQGEGVLGLRRGFFLAGVDHLIITFWPIADEETVRIVADFYNELPKTKHPGIALARVQASTLKRLRNSHGLKYAVIIAGPFAASCSGPFVAQ